MLFGVSPGWRYGLMVGLLSTRWKIWAAAPRADPKELIIAPTAPIVVIPVIIPKNTYKILTRDFGNKWNIPKFEFCLKLSKWKTCRYTNEYDRCSVTSYLPILILRMTLFLYVFVYLSVFNSLNKINLIWVPHIKYGIDYFIDFIWSLTILQGM